MLGVAYLGGRFSLTYEPCDHDMQPALDHSPAVSPQPILRRQHRLRAPSSHQDRFCCAIINESTDPPHHQDPKYPNFSFPGRVSRISANHAQGHPRSISAGLIGPRSE